MVVHKRSWIFTCFLVALSLTARSNKGDEGPGISPQSWSVTESKPVEGFKETEAEFDFHLRLGNGTYLKRTAVKFAYNGKEKKLTTDSTGHAILKIKPGKYVFEFYHTSDYLEITTDSIEIKPAHRTKMQINFVSSAKHMPMRKPVIYLYPQQPTEVQVGLKTIYPFSFTYPVYRTDSLNPGWKVKAYPDGTLEQDGKTYNYLFWEGSSAIETHPYYRKGFVVGKKELVAFLEDKLLHIGLNSKEIQDFVTYWAPEMQQHDMVYLYFMFNEEYDRYAKLTVSPKPDQLIRLMMLWEPYQPHTDASEIKLQELPHFERKGFTLVEWGGARIQYLMKCKF